MPGWLRILGIRKANEPHQISPKKYQIARIVDMEVFFM